MPGDKNAPPVPALDELDQGIMDALRADGRATNSAIAEALSVTEGTVRQRARKLLDSGVFRITGSANPEIMPEHQVCVLGLKVDESNRLEQRAREVAALPEVQSVAIVTGRYDLLVEVLVPSNHGLIGFLSGSLARVSGITSSETFLFLKTFDKWI